MVVVPHPRGVCPAAPPASPTPPTFPAARDLSATRLDVRCRMVHNRATGKPASTSTLPIGEITMAKKTIKSASKPVTLNAAELAIIENAHNVADVDAGTLDHVAVFLDLFGGLPNTADGVAEFKARRTCWVSAYMARMGCSDKSAANRFAEMVKAAEVVKPQTAEAAAKQATRAANPAKPASKGEAPAASVESIAGPAKGTAVGTKVKAELSAMEAHIVDLYRRGKFADLLALLQSEQKAAAPV